MDKSVKILAVLYADVSGSTKLYEKHGDTVARADIKTCLDLIFEVTEDQEGEVVKTIGDEAMCVFLSPVNALSAAQEMHEALRDASDMGKFQSGTLRVKIGWHYGPIEWRGDEIIGEAPVTAQQAIKLAKPEEILTSSRTIEALPDDMVEGAHPIDTIDAEAWSGKLEIFSIPWESGEDVTVFSTSAQSTPEHANLLLEYGDKQIHMNENNSHIKIGRGEDNDLCVHGQYTSRYHAEIIYRHGRFQLYDMSTNGTVIVDKDNNQKSLRRGEEIISGHGVICFSGTPETEPEAVVTFRCE